MTRTKEYDRIKGFRLAALSDFGFVALRPGWRGKAGAAADDPFEAPRQPVAEGAVSAWDLQRVVAEHPMYTRSFSMAPPEDLALAQGAAGEARQREGGTEGGRAGGREGVGAGGREGRRV